MTEKANYITCPKGHLIFVIWSPEKQRFGFTCEICGEHSIRAVSLHGTIEVTVVRPTENSRYGGPKA